MEEDFEAIVSSYRDDLVKLKKGITQSKLTIISRKETLSAIGLVARTWFKVIQPKLTKLGISKNTLDAYSSSFSGLLTYANKPSKSSSVLNKLNAVIVNFHDDIILPVLTLASEKQHTELEMIIEKIKDPDENDYLREAVSCAESEYFRAAIILGWCATIDRIHRVIEKNGFATFSIKTEEMKKMTTGRFKRFNKSYTITSISELQEVFDSDTLQVLEALGLIDNNQNTRLTGCYNLRCNCGHPGNAPITKYNAMSFFSDIIEIVLNNPTFEL